MDAYNEEIIEITRRVLFNIWQTKCLREEKNAAVYDFVLFKIAEHISNPEEVITLSQENKVSLKNFLYKLYQKWTKHAQTLKHFLAIEESWLNTALNVVVPKQSQPSHKSGFGRPTKNFQDLSAWSNRRNVAPLVQSTSLDELSFAASTSYYLSGKREEARVVREMSMPVKAEEIKSALKKHYVGPIMYSAEEALAFFVDGRFTKNTYMLMQAEAKKRNANIYPTYKSITKAKIACYPDSNCIEITETKAEVTLQALVEHTAKRLLVSLKPENIFHETSETSSTPEIEKLMLTFKWGCDGSSGHSTYKQRFSSTEESDSFLFVVCIVPLQLTHNNGEILWENPKPSSTRFCRPIKLIIKQETSELIKKEVENIQSQIKNIIPIKTNHSSKELLISFNFKLTMIDGKTFGAITDTSCQTCGICGAKHKEMNDIISVVNKKCETERYDYGLSTLHAYIRCFECILHIAYRLGIRKWQVRDPNEKLIYQEKKKLIQTNLKKELGLLVDVPKANYGTTNDGNTARTFFAHYDKVSNILGVDEILIRRFGIILKTLSSGYSVDNDVFHKYSIDTAKLSVNLYPWFYMPSSVHRILIHGASIIRATNLPIGMLSEEALEAKNKEIRRYRQFNTRKYSRIACITDLFHSLLFSSDPVVSLISSNRQPVKKRTTLDKEVRALLLSTFSDTDSDSEMEIELDI